LASGKRCVKGLSELVVIMIAVAIAIPVMFLLQAWLTGQISKMPELESVLATYEAKPVNGSSMLVLVRVANNGNSPIEVVGISVIYSDQTGSISPQNTTNTLTGSLPQKVEPKSSKTFAVSIPGVRVDSVIVSVKALDSGAQKSIKASGI